MEITNFYTNFLIPNSCSIILFCIGSLGAGLSQTVLMMILSRFVQGIGSAAMHEHLKREETLYVIKRLLRMCQVQIQWDDILVTNGKSSIIS